MEKLGLLCVNPYFDDVCFVEAVADEFGTYV